MASGRIRNSKYDVYCANAHFICCNISDETSRCQFQSSENVTHKQFARRMCFLSVIGVLTSCIIYSSGLDYSSKVSYAATQWFDQMNAELKQLNHEAAVYAWDASTLPTQTATVEKVIQLTVRKAHWERKMCSRGEAYRDFNANFHRALTLLCRSTKNTDAEIKEITSLLGFMQNIYTGAQVCLNGTFSNENLLWENTFFRYPHFGNKSEKNPTSLSKPLCLYGEPDMEQLMTGESLHGFKSIANYSSNDESILNWAWQSWRLAVGPPLKKSYQQLFTHLNNGARRAGYQDIGEMWRKELGMPDLRATVERLWQDVKPLYQKLHAVIRYQLKKTFPNVQQSNGLIPAHLAGDMWSQNWATHAKAILAHEVDIDGNFEQSNCSAKQLVKRAEDFFSSMGLPMMTKTFWAKSIFERSENVTKCHGTAANMFKYGDYRIIACSGRSMNDFYVLVHEMGHIMYYMLASNQPPIFQDGTNSAFQESVGDTIHLATMSPLHLVRLGLLNSSYLKPELDDDLNSFDYSLLLQIGLSKIPALPFSYIMDRYRWDLFDGTVNFDTDANTYFWYLLENEQGIRPASSVDRTDLFDAAAKYHFPDNTPYVRYFLANFLSFQILEGLCKKSIFGDVNTANRLPMPLHRCDIYGSKRVGRLLEKALRLGGSEHWRVVLDILTGTTEISSQPLIEYFKPLNVMLDKIITEWKLPVGWKKHSNVDELFV
ncbi:angiotensin-converting enzyme-like isoform X2 [Wyeomyia smithii]|uniref:angiotensin-converting enzyme-like isoform X2 n=1 Tax=Wyeomyia smithii TaxID=174621 RepID=UPI002467FA34|nr:angiotensin-converting enzyme-like isoform X2 [Wyeomyia smithii]